MTRPLGLVLMVMLLIVGCVNPNLSPPPPPPPPLTGSLEVTVSGLPTAMPAKVAVSGPQTNQSLTASNTLKNLSPGSYTVTAEAITANSSLFQATIIGSPAQVVAGQTAKVAVNYGSECSKPARFDDLNCKLESANTVFGN